MGDKKTRKNLVVLEKIWRLFETIAGTQDKEPNDIIIELIKKHIEEGQKDDHGEEMYRSDENLSGPEVSFDDDTKSRKYVTISETIWNDFQSKTDGKGRYIMGKIIERYVIAEAEKNTIIKEALE